MSAMPNEPITGITFPKSATDCDENASLKVLDAIATCCTRHLQQGGYLSDVEAKRLMISYRAMLATRPQTKHASMDFLAFIADAQAEVHALQSDAEIARMQRLLRRSLNDRVHYWSVGPLPGRAGSLYEQFPQMRAICSALGCPGVIAGEESVMHVASINPVAALVAASWICHESSSSSHGDAPFVFPFLVDAPTWNTLLQRHFPS